MLGDGHRAASCGGATRAEHGQPVVGRVLAQRRLVAALGVAPGGAQRGPALAPLAVGVGQHQPGSGTRGGVGELARVEAAAVADQLVAAEQAGSGQVDQTGAVAGDQDLVARRSGGDDAHRFAHRHEQQRSRIRSAELGQEPPLVAELRGQGGIGPRRRTERPARTQAARSGEQLVEDPGAGGVEPLVLGVVAHQQVTCAQQARDRRDRPGVEGALL